MFNFKNICFISFFNFSSIYIAIVIITLNKLLL